MTLDLGKEKVTHVPLSVWCIRLAPAHVPCVPLSTVGLENTQGSRGHPPDAFGTQPCRWWQAPGGLAMS